MLINGIHKIAETFYFSLDDSIAPRPRRRAGFALHHTGWIGGVQGAPYSAP